MAQYDANVTSSLIHLYRGEMGRMTAYRVRLDTTTNWAILITAGTATFALGDPSVPHSVILLAVLSTFYFMYLEARRFQVYEISHQRVRLLEQFFYHEMLGEVRDRQWHQELMASLARPRSPLTRLESLGWRLRRNYLGINLGLATVWLLKLSLGVGGVLDTGAVVSHAAVGPVPGIFILAGVGVYICAVVVIASISRFPARISAD
jgi:uncharacterized membrane protein